MQSQAMFLAAVLAAIVVAGSVDGLVRPLDGIMPATKPLPGVLAGAAFVWIMNQTGVAPSIPAIAFTVPWALAQVFSAPYYGVDTTRHRLKRASLAAACGGLGVLATFRD